MLEHHRRQLEEALRRLCNKRGVLVERTHVILSKKDARGRWVHSDTYFDKNPLLVHPEDADIIGGFVAEYAHVVMGSYDPHKVEKFELAGFVGPAISGITLSLTAARAYQANCKKEIFGVYADKVDDGFALKRGYDKLVKGKHVIVVEDVLTSGGSAKQTVEAVRKVGGIVVGVIAICNRGGVTTETLGVDCLESIMTLKALSWPEGQVPEFVLDRTIRTDIGHGADYLKERSRALSEEGQIEEGD